MGFRAVINREYRRLPHLPWGRWLFFWGPLCGLILFVALLWRGRVEEIPIALCDQDQTALSRRWISLIEASPTLMIRQQINSPIEAESLIHQGKAWAVIEIPHGFQKRILAREPAPIISRIAGSNLTVNGLIRSELQAIISTFDAEVAITRLVDHKSMPSVAYQQIEPIQLITHPLFNPTLDYGHYLAPGFLMMVLVIFLTLATIQTFGIELRRGSGPALCRRAAGSLCALIGGKLFPLLLIYVGWGEVILFILFGVLGIPMLGSWWVLEVGLLLLIIDYMAIATFVVAWSANLRLSLSLAGGYAVMAFSFSGLTFPKMAMWPPIRRMSHLFPFTPFSELLMDQTLRGAPWQDAIPQLLEIGLFALLLIPAAGRMQHVLIQKKYWYKI